MNKDNCFDFLRFFFASIVVLGHIIVISQIPILQPFKPFFPTHLAVYGFFIISGFLIHQSYYNSKNLSSYFAKRARRLLPAYWIVVWGCALGLCFMSDLQWKEYFHSMEWWKYLGANLSFMNFIHPSLPGVFNNSFVNDNSVNPALWTLKIEVAFYLCIPFFVWIQKKSQRPWILFVALYIIATAYDHSLLYLSAKYHSHLLGVLSHQFPAFLSYFAVGMAFHTYQDWFLAHKNQLIIPSILIFIVEFHFGISFLTPLAYGIIVIWFAFSLSVLNKFAKYGDISYGIYIYHAPLLKTLLSLGLFVYLPLWITIPSYLCLISVISLLSWHGVEKKFLHR